MKILCVILFTFIWCPDFSSAQYRPPVNKDPFCLKYRKPSRPIKNDSERVSQSKCNEYIWERAEKEYVTQWSKRCDRNFGIANGHETTRGEYPHMGALGWFSAGAWTFDCGASLISSNFVLTAAHCSNSTKLGKPSIVRLGATNIIELLKDYQDFNIEEIIKHPSYSSPITYHDIALIKLDQDVSFTPFIQPACLWTTEGLASIGNSVTVTGWGSTKANGNKSPLLLVADLTVINDTECNKLRRNYRNRNWRYGLQGQLCAGTIKGGGDTCSGDSGGPIQFTTINATAAPTHYLFGITSFGPQCGLARKPGVYTKVASYIDWIENIVWPQEYQDYKSLIDYMSEMRGRVWGQ